MPTLALVTNKHRDAVMEIFRRHVDHSSLTEKASGVKDDLTLITGRTNHEHDTLGLTIDLQQYKSEHPNDQIMITFL